MDKKILFGLIVIMSVLIFTISNVQARWCYQETADNQTGADGNCLLDYSGEYNVSGDRDGLIVTYQKPLYVSNNSLWTLYTQANGLQNVSIPSACWDYSSTNITLQVRTSTDIDGGWGSRSNEYCWNGTNWNYLAGGGGGFSPAPDSYAGGLNRVNDGNWTTFAYYRYISGYWETADGNEGNTGAIFEEAMLWDTLLGEDVYVYSNYSYLILDENIHSQVTGQVTSYKAIGNFFPTFIVLGSLIVLIFITILIINAIRSNGLMQEQGGA